MMCLPASRNGAGDLVGDIDTREDCNFNEYNLEELQATLRSIEERTNTSYASQLFTCNDPESWTVGFAPTNPVTNLQFFLTIYS